LAKLAGILQVGNLSLDGSKIPDSAGICGFMKNEA
jgi:hypothetical protein